MIDFELYEGELTSLLKEQGVSTFSEACQFVADLTYSRISNPADVKLVVKEQQGTCSSKHAFLASVALENRHEEVELICGIFLMSGDTHPVLSSFFQDKSYASIPEAHCYLRVNQKRYDYTTAPNRLEAIERKLVREQRIDPHQVNEWKVLTHKDYIRKFLERNPSIGMSPEEFWTDREQCIRILAGGKSQVI